MPGALPLDPVGGLLSSPQRRFASLPPERDSATNLAGFATLRLHRNWFLFLLKLHQRNTGCFQTVARGLLAPNVSAVSGLCRVCVKFVSGNLALLSHLLDLDTVNTVFLSKDIL